MIVDTSLTPEFEMACDLLYLRPQEVIEAFIQNVSLAYFCSTDQYLAENGDQPNLPNLKYSFDTENDETRPSPNPVKILATNFLLTHCALFSDRLLPAQKVHKKYFKRFEEMMPHLAKESDTQRRYISMIRLYLDWHEELITNMSENDVIIDVKQRKKNLNFKQ